jgi:hypothetical protein
MFCGRMCFPLYPSHQTSGLKSPVTLPAFACLSPTGQMRVEICWRSKSLAAWFEHHQDDNQSRLPQVPYHFPELQPPVHTNGLCLKWVRIWPTALSMRSNFREQPSNKHSMGSLVLDVRERNWRYIECLPQNGSGQSYASQSDCRHESRALRCLR